MKNAYNCITDFIFLEDQIEPSDVILIPGCSHKQLIEHAFTGCKHRQGELL